MNRFRNFMIGRYGTDKLTIAMIVIGMTLTFIGDLFRLRFLTILTYLIFFACIYRVMSKNVEARQTENEKFIVLYKPYEKYVFSKYNLVKARKNYKYFKCPNCKQLLRVPRHKGKINVTCKKCGIRFEQKS